MGHSTIQSSFSFLSVDFKSLGLASVKPSLSHSWKAKMCPLDLEKILLFCFSVMLFFV